MTNDEFEALNNAKVGDTWYAVSRHGDVMKLHVARVMPTQIELSNSTRVNKKTGAEIGAKSWPIWRLEPATPGNMVKREPQIRRQGLQSRFRRVSDALLDRHRAGAIADADYEALIAAIERALERG